MAEINKRNLVDETAKVYAENTLANNPTPLFSTGLPAKIMRASIANTNLLSKDGDLFVGTGDTYTETIDGIEYTYAKIAKKNQSELFVDGLNSTATNVGLAASVGKSIDDRLYLTGSTALGTGSIALGYDAKTTNDQAVAIGYMTEAAGGSTAIGKGARAVGTGSIALGSGATVTVNTAIQLGTGLNTTQNSFKVGNYQMLDLSTGEIPMERINTKGDSTSLALGGTSSGTTCVAYGFTSMVEGVGSIAIGYGAKALFDGGIAIGKNAKLESQGIPKNCIAIGNGAKITYQSTTENTAIQLGAGTNSDGGFQVWGHQLMDSDGIIPLERRPIYKCTVRYPNSYSPPTSSTSSPVNLYYLSWYSSTPTIPTDFFIATGYRETISSADGSNTKSTYSPCCGKIRQRNNGTISLSIFNNYGTEVTGIDESNIVSHFELI